MSADNCTTCGGTVYGARDRCRDCRESSPNGQEIERGPEPTGRLVAALVGGATLFALSIFSGFLVVPLVGFLGAFSSAPEIVTLVGVFGLSILVMLVSGGLAGYLRGSDRRESALTGGLAGLVASIPSALLTTAVFLLAGAFFPGSAASADTSPVVFAGFAAGVVLVQIGVPTVVCAIGGALGSTVTDRRAPGH